MNILRTPDERFDNLPDFPFTPNYVEVDGLRMHYVDEGNNEDEVVLMLHGEPSWSFLFRENDSHYCKCWLQSCGSRPGRLWKIR